MRLPAPLRRCLVVPVVGFLATGALLLATPAPGRADPPEIVRTELCGAVGFTWETGTIGGTETWATTVRRNDVVVDRFEMRERGARRYGAVDGDVFVIEREGLPDRRFGFEAPEGCVDAPELTVTAVAECYGVELRVVNEGRLPVAGLRLFSPSRPAPEELAPVAPGAVTLVLRLADGDNFALLSGEPGPDSAVWISGTYRRPAGCGSESIAATVTGVCSAGRVDGARVALVNRAEGAVRVRVLVDGVVAVSSRVLAAGARDELTVAAGPGAVVLVADVDSDVEFGRHTVSATCPSPTPSPTGGSPSPSGAPADGGSGGSDEGGLPVTGGSTLAIVATGALVAAGGLVLLLAARRRRTRFTAGG